LNPKPLALSNARARHAFEGDTVFNLVAAILVTAAEVAVFVVGMRHVAPPLAPHPISVRLIALPAPAPPMPADAPLTVETEPVPQPSPDAMPMIEIVAPTPEPPAAISSIARPLPKVPAAKPRSSRRAAARPPYRLDARLPAPAFAPDPAPSSARPASPSSGGTMGARAIYRPMPEIPEELRHHPMNLTAVARFRVAADGGATVDLIRPTPNPRLNTALLAALKAWRFFPAMENGRPVASTVDIRIPIRVQ
jgi:protein TonB